jgi:hypothetical protein
MRSEGLQVEMARERVKEGVEGAFIPPHQEYSRYSFKTRSIRGKSGNSGEFRRLWGKPGYSGLPISALKKRSP